MYTWINELPMQTLDYCAIFEDFKQRHKGMPVITGSTALIQYKDFFVFALNKKKYWKIDGVLHIGFSGVGGKIEDGENPLDAVLREVNEEIRAQLIILPSKKTTHIQIDGSKKDINLDGNPRFVVEFISPGVPGNPNTKGNWGLLLFIFLGMIRNEPRPADIPGVIMFSTHDISLISKNEIPLERLVAGRSIIKTSEHVPKDCVLYPTFSGKVISELGINLNELFKDEADAYTQ